MRLKHKTINRRHLLKGATALGVSALARRLLGPAIPPAQAAGAEESPTAPVGPADDEWPYHIYLPLVCKPAAHGPSKLGLHTVRSNNATGFAREVHNAGAHVALVKAVDEFGYLRDVKQVSPETVTIGRWSELFHVDASGDPAEKAAQVMQQHMPRWGYEKDVVDYWEVLNENDPSSFNDPSNVEGHVWLAQFYMAAMDIAEANDYRLALFSYSVGVPEWYEWEAIVETGVFAQAKAGGHILALHEYDWPVMSYRWGEQMPGQPVYEDRGVLTGRYRYLYRDFLIPRDEVIPLAITESGLDPALRWPDQPANHWKERYVAEMAWYDTKLREDDYVIGAAMFTIGGAWGWESYDYEELLWPGNPYGSNFFDTIVSLKDA